MFSLKKIIHAIFKRKILIVLIFISIVGAATVSSFLKTPVFESNAKILIEKDIEAEKSILLRMNVQNFQPRTEKYLAEVEIIKSYPVALAVIRQLNLEENPKRFLANLAVEQQQNSNVINIRFRDQEPEKACRVVRSVIQNYIYYRSRIFSDSLAIKFLEDQLSSVSNRLDSLNLYLASFKTEQEIISSNQQGEILSKKISDFENALTQAKTKRIGKQARLEIIKAQLVNKKLATIPATEISDSPSQKDYLTQLKNQTLQLEMERDRLLQKYTPDFPEVKNLENRLANVQGLIRKEVAQIIQQEETAIQALLAEEETLQNSIAELYKEIKNHSQQEYKLSDINRKIADTQELYSMFMKQREEARISLAKAENLIKIRTINPATVPPEPVAPKKKLNILLAILVAMLLSGILVFILDYFDHSINTAEEVEAYLNLPFLASIREIKR